LKLKIGDNFGLPVDAVTQTFGILGMRGSGKSNAAVVLAEEMFRAKIHWVAIDPKGDWWGLRSSGDGKSPGLPVVVFGGRHGDVPLEPSAGPLLADLIIEQTMTCVLDLSEFTEGEKIRFLAGVGGSEGFAARFYRRKDPMQPPTHMFLEEADDYLPQKAMRDKAKLLHDCSRLYLWGRQRGVGGTLVTQRSARIHKDVLTQSASLIVFRTTAPQDQKAILDWVKYHGQSEEVMESLSGLESGEGWIWSPEWLRVMKRVQFRRRETFDSGATPTGASRSRSPATLADVDLGAIKDKMATTIEKAKAEDPRELRKKIAELERELRSRSVIEVKVEKEIERVEVPVLKNGQLDKTLNLISKLEGLSNQVREIAGNLSTAIGRATKLEPVATRPAPSRPVPTPRPARQVQERVATRQETGTPQGGLRRMLIALAQCPEGLSNKQLGVRAQLSSKSGTFGTYLGQGRSAGWIAGSRECLMITDDGREALGAYDPLPTGPDLLNYWVDELGGGAARMLIALAEFYPHPMTSQELAEKAGLSGQSGTFGTYLGKLRTLELITGPREALRASNELFS
jgi:hypothetical protein